MNNKLTKAVVLYQKTGEGWENLFEKISIYVYEFPRRWTKWNEDRCSDFYVEFLPRIARLVQRFKPQYTFETYLTSSLKWYTKTFVERSIRMEREDTYSFDDSDSGAIPQCCQDHYTDSALCGMEDTAEEIPCFFEIEKNGCLKDSVLRRRIIYAALLHAADIKDSDVHLLAIRSGVKDEWLSQALDKARDAISAKIHRRDALRLHRNESWHNLEIARIGKKYEKNTEYCHNRVQEQMWEKRYNVVCERIHHFRTSLPHKEISKILDVPQGTVSSGIHFLRKHWNEMNKDEQKAEKRMVPDWTLSQNKS